MNTHKLKEKAELGKTGVRVAPIIFGTSCLGNLYHALPLQTKYDIMAACFEHVEPAVAFDTAGKYGAGLALQVIGDGLRELQIDPEDVIVSNKLGWLRTPLTEPEPTFEPGVWQELEYDARQSISYQGIFDCWQQGCDLLGAGYAPQIVSIHDPDEYIAGAAGDSEKHNFREDIIEGYRALAELKREGQVKAVGIGAKDWRTIQILEQDVELDWVMFACSLTIMNHPAELLAFIEHLHAKNIAIINSAVFHSGFLTGSLFFDYTERDPDNPADRPLFEWRETFYRLCQEFGVTPAAACVQFGISPPGIGAIALNTSRPERVRQNVETVTTEIPDSFWQACKEYGLIDQNYSYVG